MLNTGAQRVQELMEIFADRRAVMWAERTEIEERMRAERKQAEKDLADKIKILNKRRGEHERTRPQGLIKNKVAGFPTTRIIWKRVAASAEGLSFAEIAKACEYAIKDAIISDREKITQKDIMALLLDRKANLPKKADNKDHLCG